VTEQYVGSSIICRFDSPKNQQSESFKVLFYTIPQMLTQCLHFLSTRVMVLVRFRVSENARCSIHIQIIEPSDYRHTAIKCPTALQCTKLYCDTHYLPM